MIIINELEYAETILKEQKIDDNHRGSDLSIIAKYLFYKGNTYKQIRKFLEEFCVKNIKYFNIITDYHNIEYAINQSKNYKLSIPTDIIITQQEISAIQLVDNIDYQRFLFTLLVLGKLKKYNSTEKKFKESSKFFGLYYNGRPKDIIKQAGLRWSQSFENKLMHELHDLQFLDVAIGRRGIIIIKYAGEGYPALIITDFRNLGLRYLKHIGAKKIGECEECNSLFIRRSKLQILCPECYRRHRLKTKRDIERERRIRGQV
jgi:hypothetical protein